jgi:TonB family protein
MPANLVKNIFFAFAILSCCCFSSVFSQEKCDLSFDVYEFKGNDSENFPVKDYKVKLINAETKKSVKTSKVGEKPVVRNINEGSYIATFSKDGFQKTEDKFSINCNSADEGNTESKIVFLWKGDSRKTFKAYLDESFGTRGFVVKKTNSQSDIVNHGAITLGKPAYPSAARMVRASGKAEVQVLINELGNVVSAKAISGHPLLQLAAVEAAKNSKFKMTLLSSIPVKVNGIIVYNFVP